MNPIDIFHRSGELFFELLMALSQMILDLTGYGGTPEGVLGMLLLGMIVLVSLS